MREMKSRRCVMDYGADKILNAYFSITSGQHLQFKLIRVGGIS